MMTGAANAPSVALVTAPNDIAILTFHHVDGAERAYADVLADAAGAPWTREVAFVEVHHKHRVTVRGTFAGHFLDVEDVGDAIGRDTGEGAIAGGLVGLAFGPPGVAVGLVTGGVIGGTLEAGHVHAPRGALYDELREDVPEKSSAVLVYAPPDDVDAMIAAFGDRHDRVIRHTPTPEEAAALEAAVRQAPLAAQ